MSSHCRCSVKSEVYVQVKNHYLSQSKPINARNVIVRLRKRSSNFRKTKKSAENVTKNVDKTLSKIQ